MDEYGWNNGVTDYPTLFSGVDMVCYENNVQEAIDQRGSSDGGDLMLSYFDEEEISSFKEKVLSAIPSVDIRGGELMGCTTVRLKEPLTEAEMQDLQGYLKSQFCDGWGEDFQQQEIQTCDGMLYVFFANEPFDFEVEQVQNTKAAKEQPVPQRPKMKLVGMDGNIFAILGRASQLLRKNGQADQAKEMIRRVQQSENYYKALNIISEYVQTELSEKAPVKSRKEKERGDAR